MQKFLQTMSLLVMLMLPSVLFSQTITLACDFENDVDNAMWVFENGASSNQWIINTATHNGGSHSLYISHGDTNEHAYDKLNRAYVYAYRTVSLEVGTYDYSYDWLCNGESNFDYMRVALAPSSASISGGYDAGFNTTQVPSGWISLDNYSKLNQQSAWQSKSGEVYISTAGDYKFVVFWRNDGSGGSNPPAAIDNISLSLPACPQPINPQVSQVLFDAFTVSWIEVGEASSWNVSWCPKGTLPNAENVLTETVYEPTITIDNLLANSEYDIYIQSDCTEGSSRATKLTARTACELMSLPYREGFEEVNSYEFDSCWFHLAGDCFVVSNGYDNHTIHGIKAMSLSNGGIVATPYIPMAGNLLALDFSYSLDYNNVGSLQIGFVSSLEDLDNMIIVDTIIPTDRGYFDAEVDFTMSDAYNEGYIIFKQIDYISNSAQFYIDNIFIRQQSDCRRPTHLSVTDVTHSDALLNWTAVDGADSYEVVYGLFNSPDSLGNSAIENITDNEFAITDLISDTTYYMWVRSSCGDSYSEWRYGGTFTTQVACAVMQNVQMQVGKNSVSIVWDFQEEVGIAATQTEVAWLGPNDTHFHTATTIEHFYFISNLQPSSTYQLRLRTICDTDTSEAYFTEFSTQFSGVVIEGLGATTNYHVPSNCNYYKSYSQMLYPSTDLVGIDTISSISFNVKNMSSEMTRRWDIYMGHTAGSSLSSDSPLLLSDLTLVGHDINFSTDEGWHAIHLTTPYAYHNDSNLVIVVYDSSSIYKSGISFRGHSGSSITKHTDREIIHLENPTGLTHYDFVPDLRISCANIGSLCEAPLALLNEVTSHSVQLVWNSSNGGNPWTVEYRLATDSSWSLASNTIVDTFFTINNLLPGSLYQFRVGSQCNESMLYATLESYTECAAVNIPYIETFSQPSLNPCWSVGKVDEGSIPDITSYALDLGYHPGGYAITPMFVDDIAQLHVIFRMKSSEANAKVVVAVGEDPQDWSTFEFIDTITLSTINDYQTQECNLYSYEGSGHYLAFYSLSRRIFIDSVVVDMAPSCEYPSNVVASNVTSQSATISWSANGSNTLTWMLTYGIQGVAYKDTIFVNANDRSYTLNNLLSNTHYEVLVSNICTSDTVPAFSMLFFTTECGEIVLPYSEGFENVSTAEYHPCWHTTGTHIYGWNSEKAPLVSNRTDGHGHVLKFCDNADIITPFVPTPANTIVVSFDAKVEDAHYSGDLAIGFTTSATDLSNAIYVDTVQFDNLQWNHYAISFASLSVVEEGYVVLRNINNVPYQDWYEEWYTEEFKEGYIDNLMLSVDQGCTAVTDVQVSDITATTAKISFSDSNLNGAYTIGYSVDNDVNNITSMIDCTDTAYMLTNLLQGVRYYVWVRSNCAAGSSLWTEGPTFVTSCSPIATLPYLENFDSYTTDVASSPMVPESYPYHTLPSCWSFLNMSNVKSYTPQTYLVNARYSSEDYADSATCLLMTSNSQIPLYAVLPTFTVPVDSLQISFTYRNERENTLCGILQIGVMSDPTDTATFTLLATYPRVTTVTEAFHNFSLDNLNPLVDYTIAFRYLGGTGTRFFTGIDNVLVNRAPLCPLPENLTLIDVSDVSASFSWHGVASNYHVQYRESSNTDWVDALDATDTATFISGLNSNTEYQVRIQSDCGAHQSEWCRPITFTTDCGAMAIPYSENFDSYTTDIAASTQPPYGYPNHTLPNCWNFFLNGTYNPQIFLTKQASYVVSGNSLFFISSGTVPTYAVLPEMDEALDQLRISFSYRNESSSPSNAPLILGVTTHPSDFSTFRPLDTLPIVPSMAIAEHDFANDDLSTTDTTYYIAFSYGGYNGNYMYLSIDDILVEYLPSCAKPTNLMANEVNSSSATLSWIASASQYQFQYRIADTTDWTSISVNDNNFTLNQLSSTTNYEARVRAICNVGDTSDWSNIISFTTLCAPYELPFIEDFTDAHYSQAPNCWNLYAGKLDEVQLGIDSLSIGGNWRFSSTRPINDNGQNANIDIWNSINGWLVTPSIHIAYESSLEFDIARFDYDSIFDANDQLVVLITSNDGTTWQSLYSWNGTQFSTIPVWNDSAAHIAIDLIPYLNDTVRVAFYGESAALGDHIIHIDNVYVGAPTHVECNMPLQLTASNLTATSVTLSWQGNASQYELAYRITESNEWTVQTLSSNSYNLTNLAPSTSYQWRVRSICQEAQSNWAIGTFTTAELTCDAPTNLTAHPTSNSVTLDWDATEGQSLWEVSLATEGDDEVLYTIAEHPTIIEDLTPNTTYTVKARALCDDDFLSDWSSSTLFVTLADNPESIDGVVGNYQLSIYPNPTHGATSISLQGIEGKVVISVVDMNGRTLTTETLECGLNCEKRIELASLSQGTYFVRVLGNNVNSVRKLIVR